MARLPTPGQDSDTWGDILNDFLSQTHTSSGTLKDDSVDSNQIKNGAVASSKLAADVQTSLAAADNAIPSSQKGAASGVASLGSDTKLLGSQLPGNVITKSTNSGDTGKAIDAYTGAPLSVGGGSDARGETGGWSSKALAALLPTRLALGNRRQAVARIVVHGDSTDEGIGTGSNDRMRTWPVRMAAYLRSINGNFGGEVFDPSHPNFLPCASPSAMHYAGTIGTLGVNWWGLTAVPTGWTVDESRGPNGYALKATGVGSTLTLTIPAGSNITSMQVVYRRGPDASYGFTSTVSINGAGATASVQSSTGAVRDGTVTTSGGTSGLVQNPSNQSITLTITAGGSNTTIEGVLMFGNNFNRGTVVYNIAKGGARAKDWLPTSKGGKDWIKDNQDATVDAGVQGLIDMNPDLIIRGGFYNDMQYSGGVDAATYKQNEIDLIAGMRSVLPAKRIPVVLLTKWKPADAYLADPVSRGRIWEDYVTARDEIAAADPSVVHLNLSTILPRPGSQDATDMNIGYLDDVHGSDRAYGMLGDLLGSYLIG